MIKCKIEAGIMQLVEEFPCVGVLAPRQVGKTTLAEAIAVSTKPEPVYLDLERLSEAAKLTDPEGYFELHKGKLIILDEIQRAPELFQILRGVSTGEDAKDTDRGNSLFLVLLHWIYLDSLLYHWLDGLHIRS